MKLVFVVVCCLVLALTVFAQSDRGTITGTVSGSTIAMRLVFPAGGDGVPTPECTITFEANGSMASHDRIEATYTGTDTCEGPITGGTFTMTR